MNKEMKNAVANQLLDALQDKQIDLESTIKEAYQITNSIQCITQTSDIIVKLSLMADKYGITEEEQDVYFDEIRDKQNELEQACFNAEEMFREKLTQIKEEIEQAEFKIEQLEEAE